MLLDNYYDWARENHIIIQLSSSSVKCNTISVLFQYYTVVNSVFIIIVLAWGCRTAIPQETWTRNADSNGKITDVLHKISCRRVMVVISGSITPEPLLCRNHQESSCTLTFCTYLTCFDWLNVFPDTMPVQIIIHLYLISAFTTTIAFIYLETPDHRDAGSCHLNSAIKMTC